MKKLLLTLTSTLFVALSSQAVADNSLPSIIDYKSSHHPTVAENGMVVTRQYLASRVGRDILQKGGNAVDATIASGFALAVVLPVAGNIGGGGFMLVHDAESGETVAIDYRENDKRGIQFPVLDIARQEFQSYLTHDIEDWNLPTQKNK